MEKKSKKIKVSASALIFNSYPPQTSSCLILKFLPIVVDPHPPPNPPLKKVCYYIDYLSKNTTFPPIIIYVYLQWFNQWKKQATFFLIKEKKLRKQNQGLVYVVIVHYELLWFALCHVNLINICVSKRFLLLNFHFIGKGNQSHISKY